MRSGSSFIPLLLLSIWSLSLHAAPATKLVVAVCGWPQVPCTQALTPLGVSVPVVVVALDATDALATGYLGTVKITSSDPLATLPTPHTYTQADGSIFTFSITFHTPPTTFNALLQQVEATDTANGFQGNGSFFVIQSQGQNIAPTAPLLPPSLMLLLCSLVSLVAIRRLSKGAP